MCRRILMRQYASSTRKVDTRDEERDKGLPRARDALPVWPAYFPRRSPGQTSVPGTHCSLIEQEEKKGSSFQIFQRD